MSGTVAGPRGAGASVRRWGARARVVGRRAVDRATAAGRDAARTGRAALGVTTLPAAVWAAAWRGPRPDASLPAWRSLTPLPAPAALGRALAGLPRPSLDAWAPLGPRAADTPGVLLLPVGGSAGSWTPSDAAALLASRARRPSGPLPHSVALTAPGRERALARAVRRAAGGRAPGVLTASGALPPDGSPAAGRTAAALGMVDAVLVPDPDRCDPALARLAAAAGRAVVGPADAATPAAVLADRGRAARLDLVRAAGAVPGDWQDAHRPAVSVGREPRRVVVAGHDLKFANGLIAELRVRGHEVRVDTWTGHARHDAEASRALAAWADVVHCEWSLGNLVWHSRHARPDTRLTARTHLQEAATDFPARVRHEAVDAWVFVAEHVRAQVVRDTGLDPARTRWIPNAVSLPGPTWSAAHPVDPAQRFTLGLVGVLPERKGLDRALDVLAALRAEDPRFRLRIRGHRPEEVDWLRGRPAAQAYYADQRRRMAGDPALTGAVTWDPHGPDMASWYASVGTVLSTSTFESFHFTLPDGAAHGRLPRSLAWAGADLLYPAEWLAPDTAGLAAAVREATRDPGAWAASVDDARGFVARTYAEDLVLPALADTVLGVR